MFSSKLFFFYKNNSARENIRSIYSLTRFFSKKRIVVDERYQIKPIENPNLIKLNPYNKIKKIWKLSHLPQSHVLKALCTKEGKNYYLEVIIIRQNQI